MEDKEVILFGDFNYNYINSETTNSLWNKILNTFNLQQLLLEPTRVTFNTSTIIDHVYSNYPSQITNIQVPILSLSDHYPVRFSRISSYDKKGPIHTIITYRNMKAFKEEDFMNDLIAQPWSLIDIYEDPEDALQTFIRMFSKVLDVHAPLKEKRVKHKHQPDWFTDSIASAIRERNKAKESKNIMQYKIWHNKTKRMIFAAKRDYFNQTINQNKRNPESLWKNLKELSGKNKKYQQRFSNNNGPHDYSKCLLMIFSPMFLIEHLI